MKHLIALPLNISALWLIIFSLVQFGVGFFMCVGGNVGALLYGFAYAFTSAIVAGFLAKLAEVIEFGFFA